jgi:hypothetical protein
MQFDQVRYKGIDLSSSMLALFAEKHPGVDLLCADASTYKDDRPYDLILSTEVLQYFDRAMVKRHFANARAMMHPDSLFVCASIPWKVHRLRYNAGQMSPSYRFSLYRLAKTCARVLLGRPNQFGRWYHIREIQRLADEYGMMATIYGGMSYLYRIHAVMKLK